MKLYQSSTIKQMINDYWTFNQLIKIKLISLNNLYEKNYVEMIYKNETVD